LFRIGLTGIAFCKSALKAGHHLTIYARNSSKLPAEIKDHEKATTVQGQLDDEASLKESVDGGATVFVSFAGPVMSSPKGTVSLLYQITNSALRRRTALFYVQKPSV
jgi:putative NADH-flavin reductase